MAAMMVRSRHLSVRAPRAIDPTVQIDLSRPGRQPGRSLDGTST